ncbi:MAG: hypothetical protein N2D54_02290, partial [Chloroflexota bacterium]
QIRTESDEINNILETRIIKGGKNVFANEIVPTLGPEHFENFKILFRKILSMIEVFERNE